MPLWRETRERKRERDREKERRRDAVTVAMPFLKPGVHGCGFARLSGLQYLSISNVVLGLMSHA